MKRKVILILLLCIIVFWAQAHEFWLQPNRFFAAVGDLISIEVLVGEGFKGERSEGKKNRIVQYSHWIKALPRQDLTPTLSKGQYGLTSVRMTSPGTHLIALANTNKYLSLSSKEFLAYLKEDGLDLVIQARQQNGESSKPSREVYRRCVKTLIQVGSTPDETFATATGMPLEIIPVQNPYALKSGQTAEFRVLYQQKPLAGALVRYWNYVPPKGTLKHEQQRSDKKGRVRFPLRPGQTMVSLVWMVPYEKSSPSDTTRADWQSYWSSLTFGGR
ncbi:DUF4198 domain-containing protein [Larkinella ripae]